MILNDFRVYFVSFIFIDLLYTLGIYVYSIFMIIKSYLCFNPF